MTKYAALAVMGVLLIAAAAAAQNSAPATEDPAHNELRAVRDGLVDAFQKKDIDRMLTFLAPNVVVIVQNGEIIHGHKEVREFHKRMSEGNDPTVKNMTTKLEVDELSTLYGNDTATAFGSMNDHFQLRNGLEFDLLSHWTATLVKLDGKWQVAVFHVSTNMFDNGVGNQMIRWAAIKSGGVSLGIGIVVGLIASVLWRQTRKTQTAPT
jgi:ketosteroid isomerase-like protein